jgi:zinc protease
MALSHQLDFHRFTFHGMQVLLAPRRGSGLAAATALIRRGSVDETASDHGVASFTTSMLMRGTQRRSSERFAFDLETLGALSGESDGMDACSVSMRAAASEAPAALELLFEALREPAFDAQEHEICRQELLAHLRMAEDEKFSFTYREYLKQIFAGHGYGHPSEGELADAQRISPDDCRRWHAAAIRPETLLCVAVGDFEVDAWAAMFARFAADWPIIGPLQPRTATAPQQQQRVPLDLRRPDLQQGFIVAGFHTPLVTHADYPALRLASAALGEGFGGRIFTNLRDHKSLAYALGSTLRPYRLGGHQVLYIGTKPETIEEARAGLLEEAQYLCDNLLTDEELERAREFVTGRFLVGQQSLGARVSTLAWWEDATGDAQLGLTWIDRLKTVTPEQIRTAAQSWWHDPVIAVLSPE